MYRKNVPSLPDEAGKHWTTPLKLAGIYALVAGLWIVLSDRVLLWLFVSPEQLTRLQTFKGWIFVAATALMLAWLIRRDLSAIAEKARTSKAAQESYRALVETIPHGIQECDLNGTITFTNAGYDRIFGLASGEAIGTKIWDKEPNAEGRLALQAYLAELVANQPKPEPYTSRNLTRSGRVIDIQVDWDYLHNSQNEVVGFASIITDVTERLRAERVVRTSDRLKTELITTAAHEFRTPLTVIQGFSELLLGDNRFSAKDQREFVGCIYEKAVALGDMVENLLNLARIEEGRPIPIQLDKCSIADLEKDLTPLLKSLQVRHAFKVELAGRDSLIRADRGRIGQVLENLIDNADRYSSPGSPIGLRGVPAGDKYRLEIIDQGIGLTAEERERVFDRFYRVDSSDTAPSGLGIGLSIVRHIIEAHGGHVEIRSASGVGTTVEFNLPLWSEGVDPNG